MLIADGGTVNCGQATIASFSGSSGDATVTGTDSNWNVSAGLTVGGTGPATLTIGDGGLLTTSGATQTTIGQSGTGTVTLTDNGSTWIAKANILVEGTGTLTVGAARHSPCRAPVSP